MPKTSTLALDRVAYLVKEKQEVNELTIQKNKLEKQYRSTQDPKEKAELFRLRRDIAIKTDRWKRGGKVDLIISGELRTRLYQQGFGSMNSKDEKLMSIKKEWDKMLAQNKKNKKRNHGIMRHIIVSPSPKEMEGLTKIQKTDVLERTIRDVMKKFKERFVEKGDSISYLGSVHLDTETIHAHVYLFPYTRKGQYLSMNADRYLNKEQIRKTGRTIMLNKDKKIESKAEALKTMTKYSLRKELDRYEYQKDSSVEYFKLIDKIPSNSKGRDIGKSR